LPRTRWHFATDIATGILTVPRTDKPTWQWNPCAILPLAGSSATSPCVPFNPFGLGNVNQATKDWILDPEKKQKRSLDQDFAERLLTIVVYEGWGARPLSLGA